MELSKKPIIIIQPDKTLIDGYEVQPKRIAVDIDGERIELTHLVQLWRDS